MKFNKRDYEGAWSKVEAAGLTERQLAALKDDILRESLQQAEVEACKTRGKTTHEIGGTGSLTLLVGKGATMQSAVGAAVYWFHEHHGHRTALYRALPSGESVLKEETNRWDHAELLELVRDLLETNDEKYLRQCIQRCHNGLLVGPINKQNLHLFRRYRNDPKNGSGEAQTMINEAKQLKGDSDG
jgi:hypothetical protein